MAEGNVTGNSGSVRDDKTVPAALRSWFVLHFAVDMIVAVPLFFAPREVLALFGWIAIDPLATRLAAAALMGIGLESLLGRKAGREAFKGMLQLKVIWSGVCRGRSRVVDARGQPPISDRRLAAGRHIRGLSRVMVVLVFPT